MDLSETTLDTETDWTLSLCLQAAGLTGNTMEFASFGAHLGRAIVEYQVALVGGVVHVFAAGAKFGR